MRALAHQGIFQYGIPYLGTILQNGVTQHTSLDEAPGGGWEVLAALPDGVDEMALLTRLLS